MGQDDRRKYHRKKKQSIVSFHIVEEGEESKEQQATVVDGSSGGMRLRTGRSLPKNTRLYIKLDSEEWGEELTYHCKGNSMGLVEIIGSVMWCLENHNRPGEFEVGARFVNEIEQ